MARDRPIAVARSILYRLHLIFSMSFEATIGMDYARPWQSHLGPACEGVLARLTRSWQAVLASDLAPIPPVEARGPRVIPELRVLAVKLSYALVPRLAPGFPQSAICGIHAYGGA